MCDVIAETLFSVRLHSCKKQLRKRFLKNITSSPEYEDSVYECQKNFSEENTDSDIEELNDLIGNLHPYCCKPEKVQVNQVEATVIQMTKRAVKRKTFLPTALR